MFDIVLSSVIVLLLSPVLLLIILAIVIDTRGTPFFFQERLGKNGRTFRIIKFRTMIIGAVNHGAGIFCKHSDERVTRTGRILRKTSLDELPQLFNIINGAMSLIGPRPPLPQYPYTYENYSEKQKTRFSVRPGLTGPAQIKKRKDSWEERIVLDIEYVETVSFMNDAKIFFQSVLAVPVMAVTRTKKSQDIIAYQPEKVSLEMSREEVRA